MSATSDPTKRSGEKVEEAVEDVLADVSPHEDGGADHSKDETTNRSGDAAVEAGDSFTG